MQLLRAGRPVIVAVLVVTLLLSTLLRHAARLHAMLPGASPPSATLDSRTRNADSQTPTSTEPTAPPPAPLQGPNQRRRRQQSRRRDSRAPDGPTLATTTAPAWQDLSGIWRGEYVDASGKQLLRVVSLSISRVQDDGGIEGTLQYEAASGDGECKLHPRGSTYSADEQRLQLSPEGCSPHYPRSLVCRLISTA